MNLTKKQTEDVLSKFLDQKNGLNDIMQMMQSEQQDFLEGKLSNKANAYISFRESI